MPRTVPCGTPLMTGILSTVAPSIKICNFVRNVSQSEMLYLNGEERAGCFTLIVFLMPSGCWCSVALPRVPWVACSEGLW